MNTRIFVTVRDVRAAAWWFAIATVLTLAALMLPARSARAQSVAEAAALIGAGAELPPPSADPPADAPIDGIAPIAAAGDSSDDSAADHSGWIRSGDVETDDSSPRDRVLEIPPVAAPSDSNRNANAQPAPDGDSAPDQVGSAGEYQNDDDPYSYGIYIQQYGTSTFGVNPGPLNPPLGPMRLPSNSPAGPNPALPAGNGMDTASGSAPAPDVAPAPAPIPNGLRFGGH